MIPRRPAEPKANPKPKAEPKKDAKKASPALMNLQFLDTDDEFSGAACKSKHQVRFNDEPKVRKFKCDYMPRRTREEEKDIEARRRPSKVKDFEISLCQHSEDEISFHEEVTDHKEMSIEPNEWKDGVINITMPGSKNKNTKFIMDTGCGHDLISQAKVDKMKFDIVSSRGTVSFHTANGITETDQMARFYYFPELGKECNPYIMADSPSVLSVGKKCMDEGYSFIWLQGKLPYMTNNEYLRVDLSVKDNIPYIFV